MILPAGPLPETVAKSIPLSRARWRTAGDASGLAPGAATTTGVGAGAGAAGAGLTSSLTGSGSGAGASSTTSSTGSGASSTGVPSPSVSNSIQTCPTARIVPGSPTIDLTTPSVGEGISTVALSVMTERIGSSSLTVSPTATIHSTTSPSTTPSPISGSLNANIPMFMPPVFS